MNAHIFLPKEDAELPDSYGIDIFYITGKEDEFEVASHRLIADSTILELVTKDDFWHLIPLANIKKISFNKNFSKVIAIKEKKAMEASNG